MNLISIIISLFYMEQRELKTAMYYLEELIEKSDNKRINNEQLNLPKPNQGLIQNEKQIENQVKIKLTDVKEELREVKKSIKGGEEMVNEAKDKIMEKMNQILQNKKYDQLIADNEIWQDNSTADKKLMSLDDDQTPIKIEDDLSIDENEIEEESAPLGEDNLPEDKESVADADQALEEREVNTDESEGVEEIASEKESTSSNNDEEKTDTPKSLKGGDKMTNKQQNVEEAQLQCGPGSWCTTSTPEPTSNPDGEIEIPVSCIKVLHDNFFDEYLDNSRSGLPVLNDPEVNFTIDKVDCCVERTLFRSRNTNCCYPALVIRARGCVEYGVVVEVNDDYREDECLTPPIICCENCICIDEIIDFCCRPCPSDQPDCPVPCDVAASIDWEKATVLHDKIKVKPNYFGRENDTEEQDRWWQSIDLANKVAVVFEGTLTLTVEEEA